ncbi:MAG: 4Fe-4S binding protein [Anaerolineaceae bacterium]|nr:4Fe-4S binding protein [Anaerolineaceae bacterium]
MAHVINTDECIMCGACEGECPEGAIAEVDGAMTIDAEMCKDCGDCVAVCPVDAISPV